MSWVTDPAASGTLGYEREAVALCCKCVGKHRAGAKEEPCTRWAWPIARKQTWPSRGTGDHTRPGSQSSLQQHGKGLTEPPQCLPRPPKDRDGRVKLPPKQHYTILVPIYDLHVLPKWGTYLFNSCQQPQGSSLGLYPLEITVGKTAAQVVCPKTWQRQVSLKPTACRLTAFLLTTANTDTELYITADKSSPREY